MEYLVAGALYGAWLCTNVCFIVHPVKPVKEFNWNKHESKRYGASDANVEQKSDMQPKAPSNKVFSTKAQGDVGLLAVKIRQEYSCRTQRECEGDMKWAIPADSLLKCQSGALPGPPLRELNISLCQNKLGNPQISLPLLDVNLERAGRELERAGERG